MGVRKQRATTSKIYEMDENKDKVVAFGKKYHRNDKEFYITNIDIFYMTVGKHDYITKYQNERNIEHWVFDELDHKWRKEGECLIHG